MRVVIVLILALGAFWRLTLWKQGSDNAWRLCARQVAAEGPYLLSFSGSLRGRFGGGWELVDPGLHGAGGDETEFPGAVFLDASLARAGSVLEQEVLVSGPFRCRIDPQNPARVADALGHPWQWETPRFTAGRKGFTVRAKPEGASWRVRFARVFTEKITGAMSGYPGLQSLTRAVWVGDTSLFPASFTTFYREGGLLPILALSGQHVVVLVAMVALLLRFSVRASVSLPFSPLRTRLGAVLYREVRRALPLLAASFLYVVSQESPSMRRTLAMAVALFLLRLRRLESQPLQLALSAVACALVLRPDSLGRPGFFLSAAATGFLLALSHEGSLRGIIRGYLFLSVAMSLLVFPLTAFFFATVSWVAPLAQLVLGWVWTVFLMPAGFLLPFVAGVLPDRLLQFLEHGWWAFLAAHRAAESVIAAGYRVAVVPTWIEGCLWEGLLLSVAVAFVQRTKGRDPSGAPRSSLRRSLHFRR